LAVAEARGALQVARVRLRTLTGIEELPSLRAPALTLPLEVDPTRPGVRALELRAEGARRERSAEVLGVIPAIGAVANARATNEAGFSGRRTDWSFGAIATWDLLDGGRRHARMSALGAAARVLEAEAEVLDLALDQAVA